MNNIDIRQAKDEDLTQIKDVVKLAFYRDGKDQYFNEWEFVDRVRSDEGFIEELSLIATIDDEVVGYVLLSKASIGDQTGLALGPIAVKCSYQGRGIGKQLVQEGLKRAKELGFFWVSLTGGDYYIQFGFESASKYNIILAANHPENPYVKIMFFNDSCKKEIGGELRFCRSFYNEKGELL